MTLLLLKVYKPNTNETYLTYMVKKYDIVLFLLLKLMNYRNSLIVRSCDSFFYVSFSEN